MLYYLDIKTIIRLLSVSKDYNFTLSTQCLVRELCLLKRVTKLDIIDSALRKNYGAVLKWIYASGKQIIFSSCAIYEAIQNNNSEVLDWIKHIDFKIVYFQGARYVYFTDHEFNIDKIVRGWVWENMI